jgi:UDP-2,3-diacylglucosamine pyrophosphatase LpxH
MTTFYKDADGFMFIGDPHLCSVKPGRRIESDDETIVVTLDKLDQCIVLANEHNCVAVILGDLFNKAKEHNNALKTGLHRILRKAKHPVWCMPGNHDLLATDVTDDTAFASVESTGLLVPLTPSNSIVSYFMFKDIPVALGCTFNNDTIPTAVNTHYKTVWVTHHDVAFQGAYPGSLEPHSIEGVDLVVNGHMHRTQPSILRDNTWWVNPGNIYRQTIADAKHIPAAWKWTPDMQTPERIVLRYIEQVFDWTGRAVAPQMGDLIPDDGLDDGELQNVSRFVEQLSAVVSSEMPKTANADVLKEDLDALTKELNPNADVVQIVNALLESVAKNAEHDVTQKNV